MEFISTVDKEKVEGRNILADAPNAIPLARTLNGQISEMTIHAQGL